MVAPEIVVTSAEEDLKLVENISEKKQDADPNTTTLATGILNVNKTRSKNQRRRKVKKELTEEEKQEKLRKETIVKKRTEAFKNSHERKKYYESLVFQKQQLLFEGLIESSIVIDVCKYLTPETYEEIIIERSVSEKICGYPLCSKKPRNLKGLFRINIRKQQVYDVEQLNRFCSGRCNMLSEHLSSQLIDDVVYMRNIETIRPITILSPDISDEDIKSILSSPVQYNAYMAAQREKLEKENKSSSNQQSDLDSNKDERKENIILSSNVVNVKDAIVKDSVNAYADRLMEKLPILVEKLHIKERN